MKKTLFIWLLLILGFSKVSGQKFEELALTPPMGWNSWNRFGRDVNETIIKEIADAIVATGLKDAGYEYIIIDDHWRKRDKEGNLYGDSIYFPSGMKALADYIHSKGLKFGIYSDAGRMTCATESPGSLGHEYQDARTFAAWGVDYLKHDWCHTENLLQKGAYKLMSDALRAAGRPVLLAMCDWGFSKPWEWAKNVAHTWRINTDIANCFDCEVVEPTYRNIGFLQILDIMGDCRKYAGPGHWNDPDMLQVGNGMSENENRAHFSLWAMFAAPLILGNDLRSMDASTLNIIRDRDVIAVNQDSLGIQALKYSSVEGIEVYFKPLIDGDWAICFLNRTQKDKPFTINWQDYIFTDVVSGRNADFNSKNYKIWNIWTKKAEGNTKKNRTVIIPSHDVILYRLHI